MGEDPTWFILFNIFNLIFIIIGGKVLRRGERAVVADGVARLLLRGRQETAIRRRGDVVVALAGAAIATADTTADAAAADAIVRVCAANGDVIPSLL